MICNISKSLLFSVFLVPASFQCQVESAAKHQLASDSIPSFKHWGYFSDNPKQSELDKLIDSTLENFMLSPENCGMSIAVASKNKNFFYNYGEIKRDSKIPTSSNSIYEIGSITKTFCGLLLAQAVTENKIKLEDDIRKYLPVKYSNLVFYGKPIRVKHLANHSSGLPRIPENMTTQHDFDNLNPYKNYTKHMLLTYLSTVKLEDEPGSQFLYSPLGIALLGILLEEIYERSFEELLKEKILIPLKLENTAIRLSEEQVKNFTSAYDKNGDPVPHWEMGVFAPAGAIRSCTKDMLRYLEENRMETDRSMIIAHLPTSKGKETVALSWFLKRTKQGNNLIWHNGATYGSAGFCGFIKEKECSVIILTNSETNVDFLGIAILNYLQK